MKDTCFDNKKYIEEQSKAILERISLSKGGKLYLEFGGKLIFDYHAARVLPGYDPNIKIKLLQHLKTKIDVILCIYAEDIEQGKIRGDFGTSYEIDILRLIDELRDNYGIEIKAVVITRFNNQPNALRFKKILENRNIKVYLHYPIEGYPGDIEKIVSDEGYGKNPYIETEKPVVVITAPGPGSGKLATCLSQLYHDYKRGIKSIYAKFETFPVWNLPLKHPVNLAYEAATADIGDVNMVDSFHLSSYNQTAVNYNRDVEAFPLVKKIMEKITGGELIYKSPTDMGVNRVGFAIINDEIAREAAKQEIIRRYFRYNFERTIGRVNDGALEKVSCLMQELDIKPEDRKVVVAARKVAKEPRDKNKEVEVSCGAAIDLKNGEIITGKNSPLMSAASAMIINAIKKLAGIPDKIHLLHPNIILRVKNLKKDVFSIRHEIINLEETLICLSISAETNSMGELALKKLKELEFCDVHLTHIPSPGDESALRKLKINFTFDKDYPSKSLLIN